MTLALPRFQSNAPLVDENGFPTETFHIWWDMVASNLESAFNQLSDQVAAIAAAQAAAAAAQTAANNAQTTANTAQSTATTAQTTANTAQSTATAAATTADWSGVADDNGNKPADNATVGATLGTDVSGTINTSNISSLVGTLAVNTPYIANNAVTNSVSAYTAASITVPNTSTWTDIQSVTLTTTGAPLSIEGFFYAGSAEAIWGSSSPTLLRYQLVRDSTVIFGPVNMSAFLDSGGNLKGTGTNSCLILDQPSAGSHTYKLQAISSGLTCTPTNRSIIITETKK